MQELDLDSIEVGEMVHYHKSGDIRNVQAAVLLGWNQTGVATLEVFGGLGGTFNKQSVHHVSSDYLQKHPRQAAMTGSWSRMKCNCPDEVQEDETEVSDSKPSAKPAKKKVVKKAVPQPAETSTEPDPPTES